MLCEQLDVDAILKAVDKDCDGRINYEEFCNYLCQNDAVSCMHNRRDSVLGLKPMRENSAGRETCPSPWCGAAWTPWAWVVVWAAPIASASEDTALWQSVALSLAWMQK